MYKMYPLIWLFYYNIIEFTILEKNETLSGFW